LFEKAIKKVHFALLLILYSIPIGLTALELRIVNPRQVVYLVHTTNLLGLEQHLLEQKYWAPSLWLTIMQISLCV
jgi:hypothetical protein